MRAFFLDGRNVSKSKATLIGLLSVVFWSANIGLIRTTTQMLGAVGGAAVLYSISAVLLFFTFGFPKLRAFPRTYLYIASVLFCVYEVCFVLSLGYATSGRQTLELGMINYLWPSMTIAMAILFNKQKANFLVIPGMALAIVGLGLVLGDGAIDIKGIWANIQENPLAYSLSFAGAFLWSVYCTITARMAQGKNGVTFFFMLTALFLWSKFLLGDNQPLHLTMESGLYALMASGALAFGYAAWNLGILHGNVTILAAASYFIPIFSSMLTAFLLSTPLTFSFWQGCILTTAGSFLCWLSTRTRRNRFNDVAH